jgi:hypothetical protein
MKVIVEPEGWEHVRIEVVVWDDEGRCTSSCGIPPDFVMLTIEMG